jgi:hypothetical protein
MNEMEVTMSKQSENNNQQVIDGLKRVIVWLEKHPDMPPVDVSLSEYVYGKDELLKFASTIGSFTKEVDESYYRLVKTFSDKVKFKVAISREQVCKKVVTWECPEDGLLALAEEL